MKSVSISEASFLVGVSIDTLRRWDKRGIIRATRDNRGVRYFNLDEIERVKSKRDCRTSGHSQGTRNYQVLKDESPNGYKSLDLFAGAGGTALGLENAGFQHVLLSEIDKDAADTLRVNRPEWNVIEGDVANLDFKEFTDEIDLLEGGFPCQAFSYAGNSRGFEDTRGTMFFQFARAISESMPKMFIGENVRGLLRHDGGKTLETMMNTLKSIRGKNNETYRVAYRLVKAQYHDVPQKRERLLIMGIRSDIGDKLYFPRERDYIVSLWDAIGDYPKSEGQSYPLKKKAVLKQVPEGGYWKDLPEDVAKSYMGSSYYLGGGKTGMARRLSWDEPSLTLTCSPAQKQTERCHPEETRPLNVREYARIQTFPDEWQFKGGTSAAYKQIGNAVPVNLGYYIGKCAYAALQGSEKGVEKFVVPANETDYVI